MLLVTVLLTFIISLLFLFYRNVIGQYYKKYSVFYNLPGPLTFPLIGSSYLFLGRSSLDALQEAIKKYGKRLVLYIPHRTYVTYDPEEIQIILNQTSEKSKEYNHLKVAINQSLLLCEASIWKKNRKLISKSFKQNLLESFVPVFYQKSCNLVDILQRKNYGDIYELFERLFLDGFCETNIGIKSSILYEENNIMVSGIIDGQKTLFGRIGNLLKMNDFIFSLMADGRRMKACMKRVFDYFQPIIDEKETSLKNPEFSDGRFLPFLDLMVAHSDQENFTREYIVNEITLFATAATDSSAYTLAYTLCLLAMNPEIQIRVYDEIMSVIGEGEISANHLSQLKYTDMAINEALRLLPVIPMVGRRTTSDLDIGTCILPKDTGIVISILNLHHDEAIYPDPLKYDPDRFLPENVAKRHPYSYLPFSAGPRNCIGLKYAQLGIKTAIANILRTFHITTPYKSILELKFESTAVLSTTHPLEIDFVPRTKTNAT